MPWALAGPTGAGAAVRHYAHDAWRSASVTVSLPARGAVMGALAPVLTPNDPGERRCVLIGYPILRAGQADRQSANAEWAADLGEGLRTRLGVRVRARQRQDLEKAAGMDRKLSRGHSLTRPYAVATVTVPAARPIEPYARGLEAAVRRAGFAPVRLDLAQDSAFAAAVIPLGVSLTRTRDMSAPAQASAAGAGSGHPARGRRAPPARRHPTRAGGAGAAVVSARPRPAAPGNGTGGGRPPRCR